MLNNYLIYFYQPSKESGIPNLIPQGRIVLGILTIIGLIKAIGHIIDAVTDPLNASCSDKSRHPDSRRIPLMKKAAIPFGLCALLMFFVPLGKVSGLNAVWIAAFMWGYYFFFTLYMIPHNALIPELIQDGPLRVNAYTVSSFFFVTGSALGYVSPLIVSLFKGAGTGDTVGVAHDLRHLHAHRHHPVRHRDHRHQSGGHLRRGQKLHRQDGQLPRHHDRPLTGRDRRGCR